MGTEIILQFDRVSLTPQPPYEHDLNEVSLALHAGELGVVRLSPETKRVPLADLAEGIATPMDGRVLFLNKDWQELRPDAVAAARARIGRVFEEHAWVSNLDIDENITLSQRHHTHRTVGELDQEAEALARSFGLTGLPRARPTMLKASILRKAQWLRAFLGAPSLIVLEHPLGSVHDVDAGRLLTAVHAACTRGAAVLWIAETSSDNSRALVKHAAQVWTFADGTLSRSPKET